MKIRWIIHIQETRLAHESPFGAPCCKSKQQKRPLAVSINDKESRADFFTTSTNLQRAADRDEGRFIFGILLPSGHGIQAFHVTTYNKEYDTFPI
jgi:hypothetical protein